MLIRNLSIAAGLAAMTAASAITSVAIAQDDPIAERQELMKSNGQSMRVLVPMARGQAEYDAAAALAEFVRMNEVAMQFGELFPEGSETGGDTRARAEIWTDRAGFDAEVLVFQEATAAAVAAEPADLDAFRPVFGAVGQTCGTCHEKYQIPDG